MRPISILLVSLILPICPLAAQDPVAAVLRVVDWPEEAERDDGLDGSLFCKQYFGVSDWNLTGFSVGYTRGSGRSSIVACRDGIPGFSWYHAYLSHSVGLRKVTAMVQLRFSLIDLKDRPSVLRIGGNIVTGWQISPALRLQTGIYDFPGWLFPGQSVARGDPAMQFLLFHEPGRQLRLVSGFRISQAQFGPLTAGVGVGVGDQVDLTGILEVLPFGFSIGIHCQFSDYRIQGWLGHTGGLGLTPVVVVGRR